MNIRFHHRTVCAQLLPSDDFALDRNLHDPGIEFFQGLWLDLVCQTDHGGIIWHLVEIDPTELPQQQAVTDIAFCLSVAVLIQPFDDQHPDHHFNWCGIPACFQGFRIPFRQVFFDEFQQVLIF